MADALPSTIGRFEILERLDAEGSAGSLYLARDPTNNRRVIVKCPPDSVDDEERLEQFARRAALASQLWHLNVATVFDVGSDAGRPFAAVEHVEGITFDAAVRNPPAPPLDRKLHWLQQLCDGVAYMHGQGIIHGDINPFHVMVNADDEVRIVGFGSLRLARGAQWEKSGDVFGVGTLAYELLASDVSLPDDIQLFAIISTALEADAGSRYQDLIAMKGDIERARRRLAEGPQQLTMLIRPQPVERGRTDPSPTMKSVFERAARRRAQQMGELLQSANDAMKAGEFLRVQELCEEVLVLEPDNAEALALHEHGLEAGERRRAARIALLVDTATYALAIGAVDRAQEICEQVLVLEPTNSAAEKVYARAQTVIDSLKR